VNIVASVQPVRRPRIQGQTRGGYDTEGGAQQKPVDWTNSNDVLLSCVVGNDRSMRLTVSIMAAADPHHTLSISFMVQAHSLSVMPHGKRPDLCLFSNLLTVSRLRSYHQRK